MLHIVVHFLNFFFIETVSHALQNKFRQKCHVMRKKFGGKFNRKWQWKMTVKKIASRHADTFLTCHFFKYIFLFSTEKNITEYFQIISVSSVLPPTELQTNRVVCKVLWLSSRTFFGNWFWRSRFQYKNLQTFAHALMTHSIQFTPKFTLILSVKER